MDAQRASGLPLAVEADLRSFEGPVGRVAYYRSEAGEGTPVVLVHSVNAAASTFELKPVFEALQGRHPLYALELPGFGHSARPAVRYTIRTFVDAVAQLVDIARSESGQPVAAVALSLGSEFLARAVVERPQDYARVALITPTGFNRGSDRLREPGATREVPGFSFFFEGKPWSRPLFDLLTSRPSIGYFLRRTFGSADVPPELIDYAHSTARPKGAERAPFSFLSGRLFAKDVRTLYEQLAIPVWVPHGTRGDFQDFSESGWAEARAEWTFEPYASGAMPHWEQLEEFEVGLRRWLGDPAGES